MKRTTILRLLAATLITISVNAFAQPEGPGGPGGFGGPMGGPMGGGPMGGPMGGNSSGAAKTYDFGTAVKDLWKYDKSSDTYYVIGLMYCTNPADKKREQLGIYVPAAYMNAVANSDSTFTCTVKPDATVGNFTAATAPIVIPVNTPGYSAMGAPSGANSRVAEFTSKGLIYLAPGCRGKDSGAPTGITDLKAAIRYYRYLAAEQKCVPGDTDRIFSFGHSGGGAQSSLLGASGNSPLYDEYLKAIGAVEGYRDDICGAMCWCPITNLDKADGAYEWNMGLTRSNLSETYAAISKALAADFAKYINSVGFRHPVTGRKLKLKKTADGYFQSGSYYEYTIEVINDAVSRYNKFNNAEVASYDAASQTALSEFAAANKKATKGLGAFDDYDGQGRTSAENQLFDPDGKSAHFDSALGEIVGQVAPEYSASFAADLAKTDALGIGLQRRLMMYTPLFYLMNSRKYYNGGGKGSSTIAPHWRIRTGISQGDAALCTEADLALGLHAAGIKDIDFETIWKKGHTEAEDSGNANANFIEWVENCCK